MVIGRAPGHPELMKPHPDSINRALAQLGVDPHTCAFVGDPVTDVVVSQATGVRCIGYAKNPRRGRELSDAGADAVAADLTELAALISAQARAHLRN